MMDHIILKRKSFVWFKTIRRSFKTLQRAIIPDYINHPLDHARLTTAGAYRALCYVKLNDKRALEEVTEAYEIVQSYPDSIFTSFIKETLQIIQKL